MLRIRSTDGRTGTTQPWRFFYLEGRGEMGWESAGIATERSDGGITAFSHTFFLFLLN